MVVVDFEEKRFSLSDCLIVMGWQRPFNSLVEIEMYPNILELTKNVYTPERMLPCLNTHSRKCNNLSKEHIIISSDQPKHTTNTSQLHVFLKSSVQWVNNLMYFF